MEQQQSWVWPAKGKPYWLVSPLQRKFSSSWRSLKILKGEASTFYSPQPMRLLNAFLSSSISLSSEFSKSTLEESGLKWKFYLPELSFKKFFFFSFFFNSLVINLVFFSRLHFLWFHYPSKRVGLLSFACHYQKKKSLRPPGTVFRAPDQSETSLWTMQAWLVKVSI